MKYVGGKNKILKDILPIILADRRDSTMFYDICCGGGSVVSAVTGRRTAVDINPYTIEALKLIRDNPNSLPRDNTEFTKEDYLKLKESKEPKGLAGVIGFGCAFSGQFFGVWARDSEDERDFVKETFRNAQKQSPKLSGVHLIIGDYDLIDFEPNSVIYIDPPYKGTAGYKGTKKIDYDKFWQWVRDISSQGHRVFVSEYQAPDDFACVWQKAVKTTLTQKGNAPPRVERLYTLNPKTAGMLF